jgi:hypothetical protein
MYDDEKRLIMINDGKKSDAPAAQKFAVNELFFKRLRRILAIIVPGVNSPEFGVVTLLGALLIARTVFSVTNQNICLAINV